MNWIPVGGVVPSPVEFGAIGGAAWLVVAIAAVLPAMLVASGWLEIGIRESFYALVDLVAPNEADRRVA